MFAYAVGDLGGERLRAFEARLGRSPGLRREVERYGRLAALLAAAAEEEVKAPKGLAGRVNRQVAIRFYLGAASGVFEGILGAYGRAVLYYLR